MPVQTRNRLFGILVAFALSGALWAVIWTSLGALWACLFGPRPWPV